MGGEADDRVRTCSAAGVGDGGVVLADVNAVRLAGADQIGAVVDQKQRVVAVGGRAEDRRGLEQLRVGGPLSRSWIRSTPPLSAPSSSAARAV